MNIEYEKNGDFMIPKLQMDLEPEGEIRKYGDLRWRFLKEHRRATFGSLRLMGKMTEHLLQIQEQAEERLDVLMSQMAKQEGVDEQLKAADQMAWVCKMENIKARAEEIVLTEIVYQ